MTKNKIMRVAIIVFLVSFILSCSGLKRPAIGPDDVILVLSDKKTFDMHKFQLEEIYNDPIFTPMKEHRFNIRRISLNDFEEGSSKYKFLILLVNVDSESSESVFIKKMLSERVIQGVREGRYFYAAKEDVWSRGQTVLLLMDSRSIHLGQFLDRYTKKIFSIFNSKMIASVKKRLFNKRYNNEKAQEYVREKYNVDVFVPHDYIIAEESPSDDFFVRFRRFNPDRWLTISRMSYDPDLSFQDNIISTRNKLGSQFGDSVRVNPEKLEFEPDTLFSENGLMAKGIWEYSEGGGPFFSRAFVDEGTLYFIDGAVFAPGEKKYPFVIQLKLMSETVNFLERE